MKCITSSVLRNRHYRRAPQGARGLKFEQYLVVEYRARVAPRKGRVG